MKWGKSGNLVKKNVNNGTDDETDGQTAKILDGGRLDRYGGKELGKEFWHMDEFWPNDSAWLFEI